VLDDVEKGRGSSFVTAVDVDVMGDEVMSDVTLSLTTRDEEGSGCCKKKKECTLLSK
jgi:hypothetical protein